MKKRSKNKPLKSFKLKLFVIILILFDGIGLYLVINASKKTNSSQPPTKSVSEVAQESKTKCNNKANWKTGGIYQCYAKIMESISYKYGRNEADKTLFAIQQVDEKAKACHFIAHGIGWGSYKRDPSNLHELLADSNPMCSYGEQMGIIEMYTQTLPDGTLKKKDVANLCGVNPRADCNHAVGHMMLLQAKNDLGKAIDLCNGITDSRQNYYCLTGSFMEHFIGSNLLEHGLIPKSMANWPSRLLQDEAFCRTFTGTLANACWREIAHPAYWYFQKDPKRIFDFCDTAPEVQMQRECKSHSIPEIAGGQELNLSNLKPICQLQRNTDTQFEGSCYATLVSLKINFVNANDAIDTVDFCNSLDVTYKNRCFSSIRNTLSSINAIQTTVDKYCSKFPEDYKNLCKGAQSDLNNSLNINQHTD